MGAAMISGWEDAGVPSENILIVEPEEKHARDIQKQYGVEVIANPDFVEKNFHPDVILFAIKPQVMDKALPNYVEFAKKDKVFLSIAAGKDINFLENKLGKNAAIVRAMPNLPATIGKGITVLVANKKVSKLQKAQCTAVMEAVGEVIWIDDEKMMDAVTAVSGSGPAYVFYFIEAIVKAGVELGLPKEIAEKLAFTTVRGSAKLAETSESSLSELITQVTSPGGTTEAALKVLTKNNNFHDLIQASIKAAAARSKELKD